MADRPSAAPRPGTSAGTTIGLTAADSTSPPATSPYRAGAPNVVVVVLDDTGFAQLGCYGSDIATPAIDGLAGRGIRLTNFHTTAICSPTRACLLTGRNHHRVGVGMLPDLPMNFPGYEGRITDEAGTLAQILRADGYATFCVGKWHITPRDQRSPSGPFHNWPLGKGFEHYYGFLGGDANHWAPELVRDNSYVDPPRTPEEGYHLTEDLADEAIARLRELRRNQPERPFLLWLGLGATHAPHHVASEWSDPYRGRFDAGWDEWRHHTLGRQVRLGIVPEGTVLPTPSDHVPDWDGLPADERLHLRCSPDVKDTLGAFCGARGHGAVRVLGRIESSGWIGQVAGHVIEGVPGRRLERGVAGNLPRLHVQACKLGLVVQHLLEVRHPPTCVHGITVEPAADVVVNAARVHLAQRLEGHGQRPAALCGAAGGRVNIEQEFEQGSLGKLGRLSKSAVLRVEAGLQLRECPIAQRVDGRPADRRCRSALRSEGRKHPVRVLDDPLVLILPHRRDLGEYGDKSGTAWRALGREIGASKERLEFGRQPGG